MKNPIPLLLLIMVSASVQGQDTIPDSVRQMILQSQQGSQYEQMARMQMDIQFGAFLLGLSGDAQRRSGIEAALLQVLTTRVEMSAAAASGGVTRAQLQAVTDPGYLREQMAPLLSSDELAVLDGLGGAPSDEQMKQDYVAELRRSAPGLSAENRELVLDTLVRHLRADAAGPAELAQLSVDDLVRRQMQSVMRAGQELQTKITGGQLEQVMGFLNQLQTNLYLNRTMSVPPH